MTPRSLPIFPLPLILFPGVTLPLHIFEPRYRRMLADCLEGDRRFGLIFLPEGTAERELPAGHVGCVATIGAVQPLPDGRSNITVTGGERFALRRFVDSHAPYHVAEVADHTDCEEGAGAQEQAAERVREQFVRVARAARALSDDRSPLPELPDEPALLSFRIASLIDLAPDTRQRLLASRSPLQRLLDIDTVLSAAAEPLERRAAVHVRAKHNGRGPEATP